ncbi:MAG: ferric reductase-like transmembrane domain-containing protein [Candidatus Izimaplasma sp.]|nr:ferric reductase-like transmembrane domain-containing protein [Candidatus Izimaplasma bacterium]
MLILIFVSIIFILSILLSKQIHKFNYYIYALAFVISMIATGEKANIISLGYVALSYFIVVMYTGVFDKGKTKKKLMTVRAENAILGTIFLIPHAYGFLEFYLDDGRFFTSLVPVIGLIALLIAIPLFITSFRFTRKRFTYKEWKTLHKLAYAFYITVYLHLVFIDNSRLLIYTIIFGLFFILKGFEKLKNHMKTQKKLKKKMIY